MMYGSTLTLKMTSAQAVETSVTNNSSSQNYPHPHMQTFAPGFSERKFLKRETCISAVLCFEKPYERDVFRFNAFSTDRETTFLSAATVWRLM